MFSINLYDFLDDIHSTRVQYKQQRSENVDDVGLLTHNKDLKFKFICSSGAKKRRLIGVLFCFQCLLLPRRGADFIINMFVCWNR